MYSIKPFCCVTPVLAYNIKDIFTAAVKLDWTDYFVNKIHHEKKFLNKIRKFPNLVTDIELIGIRNVEK